MIIIKLILITNCNFNRKKLVKFVENDKQTINKNIGENLEKKKSKNSENIIVYHNSLISSNIFKNFFCFDSVFEIGFRIQADLGSNEIFIGCLDFNSGSILFYNMNKCMMTKKSTVEIERNFSDKEFSIKNTKEFKKGTTVKECRNFSKKDKMSNFRIGSKMASILNQICFGMENKWMFNLKIYMKLKNYKIIYNERENFHEKMMFFKKVNISLTSFINNLNEIEKVWPDCYGKKLKESVYFLLILLSFYNDRKFHLSDNLCIKSFRNFSNLNLMNLSLKKKSFIYNSFNFYSDIYTTMHPVSRLYCAKSFHFPWRFQKIISDLDEKIFMEKTYFFEIKNFWEQFLNYSEFTIDNFIKKYRFFFSRNFLPKNLYYNSINFVLPIYFAHFLISRVISNRCANFFKNSNRFLETFKKISKTSIRGWNNDLLDNSFLIDNNKIYLKLRGLQVYNFRQKINKYMVRKNKHMRKNLAEKNVNFLD
jgi:hypothetical protein